MTRSPCGTESPNPGKKSEKRNIPRELTAAEYCLSSQKDRKEVRAGGDIEGGGGTSGRYDIQFCCDTTGKPPTNWTPSAALENINQFPVPLHFVVVVARPTSLRRISDHPVRYCNSPGEGQKLISDQIRSSLFRLTTAES